VPHRQPVSTCCPCACCTRDRQVRGGGSGGHKAQARATFFCVFISVLSSSADALFKLLTQAGRVQCEWSEELGCCGPLRWQWWRYHGTTLTLLLPRNSHWSLQSFPRCHSPSGHLLPSFGPAPDRAATAVCDSLLTATVRTATSPADICAGFKWLRLNMLLSLWSLWSVV
jgi:hypothetical protein